MSHCEFCGAEVNPTSSTTYQHVEGWEHPRTKGGTNAIALRKSNDRFACFACIKRQQLGIPIGQTALA